MAKLETVLRQFLSLRERSRLERRHDCPEEALLSRYVAAQLPPQEEERVADHLVQCARCLGAVAQAQGMRTPPNIPPTLSVPMRIVEHAQRLARGGQLRKQGLRFYVKKHRYLLLAIIAFAASFLFPRHFFQWLVAASILGGKWVFDTASTRALVMIYQSWRKDRHDPPDQTPDDIEQRLKRHAPPSQ